MGKYKKHDMKIVETSDYGYVSKCDECDKTYIYDSNDKTSIYKFIILCLSMGAIIGILMEIFNF